MILLTGATGSVGLEVAKLLSAQGIHYRAMVRDIARASTLGLGGADWVQGNFDDSASIKRSLAGIERVFLLTPPVENLDRIEIAFLDVAREADVRHVVNLSAVGAGLDAAHRFGQWHGRTEKYLQDSGLDFTILRPNFFMQNLLTFASMVKGGTLYVPAGSGIAPFVDVRDIAVVAARCLTEPGHEGKTYEVTGPQAIGYSDIAATLTNVLGRDISYVDITVEAAAESMLAAGMQTWLVEALNELNTGLRENRFATLTDTVQRVGRKTPITLETFIQDHVDSFR